MASLKKPLGELKQENLWLVHEEGMTSLKKQLEELKQDKISLLIKNRLEQEEIDSLTAILDTKESKARSLAREIWLDQQEIDSLTAILNTKEHIKRSLYREIWLEQWTVEQESSVPAQYLSSQHLTEKRNTFDLEKQSALDNCQKTFEEQFNDKLHELEQQLISTQAEIDRRKLLHAKACDERTAQRAELTQTYTALVKEFLEKVSQGRRERQLARLQTEDNPEHRQKEHERDVQE